MGLLTLVTVLRTERDQVFKMADAYWREIRPTGDHFANDPVARSKYFDDEFWNEEEDRFLWWGKADDTIVGFAQARLLEDLVWTRLGYITDFYIAPPFRRRGHGTAFADAIHDWFAQRSVTTPGWEPSLGGFPTLSLGVGEFLIKDLVLLGAAFWTLTDSLKAAYDLPREA